MISAFITLLIVLLGLSFIVLSIYIIYKSESDPDTTTETLWGIKGIIGGGFLLFSAYLRYIGYF